MGFCFCCCKDKPHDAVTSTSTRGLLLLAFVNGRAGGNDGHVFAERLLGRCGWRDDTVYDLVDFFSGKLGDEDVLAQVRGAAESGTSIRAVAAGGDSTVSYVSDMMARLSEQVDMHIPVAVIPLGTGNELAGALGWTRAFNLSHTCHVAEWARDGHVIEMNRWTLDIASRTYGTDDEGSQSSSTPERLPDAFSCFLSVGFDAHIANRFHERREAKPDASRSRLGNKLLHVWYGLGNVIKPSPRLADPVVLRVDGADVPIPPQVRCIHVLNIRTTGDGLDLFRSKHSSRRKDVLDDSFREPACNDGLVEIVGTTGPLHLVSMRMLPSRHAIRLAQGSDVEILVDGSLTKVPIQVEGEPCILPSPTSIRIHSPTIRYLVTGPKPADPVVRMPAPAASAHGGKAPDSDYHALSD